MRDLLIIIVLIILVILLHIYLNIDDKYIDEFTLPIPFLGPIEFRDFITDEKLGEYPENWSTNSPENYEITTIKIKQGPRGDRGAAGIPSGVGICQGEIDIESINSEKLEINVPIINMNVDKVNIQNEICIGDKCINDDLITKIKYNTQQSNDLKNAREEIERLEAKDTLSKIEIDKLKKDKILLEGTDKSHIKTINKDSDDLLEISGSTLEFTGDRVNFENKFCINNFCLTPDIMEKIAEHPVGQIGAPGKCEDSII
tara:strand:+ start:4193 stop:4966 length:774 start_codon:yes stop_codon:yes gene_type:complete